MLAHSGLDVRIRALTCAVADAAQVRCQRPRGHGRPASTGCGRLLAAVCAKYVPKFQAVNGIRKLIQFRHWVSFHVPPTQAATLIARRACLRRGRALVTRPDSIGSG
jgi:hypothetical protein